MIISYLAFEDEKCDLAKSIEMQVCPRPMCEKCENFITPCAGENVECVDVDESKTCICKKPFTRDNSGDCKKCNVLRPFSWQCDVGKSLFDDLFETLFSVPVWTLFLETDASKKNGISFMLIGLLLLSWHIAFDSLSIKLVSKWI